MDAKPTTTSFPGMIQRPPGPDAPVASPPATGRWRRLAPFLVVAVALCLLEIYHVQTQYRASRLARTVRELTGAGKLDQAGQVLHQWLEFQPRSAEAHYYRARLALAADRPAEAVAGVEQALRLGFDRKLLSCLTAIMQARSNHFKEAEPALVQAYQEELEPRADVARELARGYLSTYRLNEAEQPLERWRTLAPDDARPYLWRNEIVSRSGGATATLIQNYRAALERDPNLDKARLGLAEVLAVEGKFDEAELEYKEHLKRKPSDPAAMVGLGLNALHKGEIEAATQHFEDALKADPRRIDAQKELAQIDLRQRRYQKARDRLHALIQIEPYDQELRYAYAQALRLSGDVPGAQAQNDMAARLRQEQEQILSLRRRILNDPRDLASRHQLANWMFEHGHGEEGLKWAREILRADPRHVPTHRLLADYYAKQGDSGLANYHRLMASDSSR